jgi:hypothetical protein
MKSSDEIAKRWHPFAAFCAGASIVMFGLAVLMLAFFVWLLFIADASLVSPDSHLGSSSPLSEKLKAIGILVLTAFVAIGQFLLLRHVYHRQRV